MYMEDWIKRLDEFLTMTGNEILDNAGTISHQEALEKAHNEYSIYKASRINELSNVEKDFIKKLETTVKKNKNKK